MPIVELPDGRRIDFPDDTSEEEILRVTKGLYEQNQTSFVDPAEEDPYADERTIGGQIFETAKGIPRGFASGFTGAGIGIGELADAVTNKIGFEDLIDDGDDNALIAASKRGRDFVQEKLGADKAYQDQWFTKAGDVTGQLASIFTPAGLIRGLGFAGQAAKATELGAMGSLAVGQGASEQEARIEARRAEGFDVTEDQEDLSIIGGGFVGFSELASPLSILGRINKNANPAFVNDITQRIISALKSAGVEGVQEVAAKIAQDAIERGVYNEDLPNDMSVLGALASDEFTLGAAAGFLVDFAGNALINRKRKITDIADKEYEASIREEQEKRVAEGAQAVTNLQQDMAVSASVGDFISSLDLSSPESSIIPPPQQPTSGSPIESYASQIEATLGANFPEEGRFQANNAGQVVYMPPSSLRASDNDGAMVTPEPTPEGLAEAQAQQASFDGSEGIAITAPMDSNASNELIVRLNQRAFDRNIGKSVAQIINNGSVQQNVETNETNNYDQDQIATLSRIGDRVIHPQSDLITAPRVNLAANTIDPEVYNENASAQDVFSEIAAGNAGVKPTAAQKLNESRLLTIDPEVNKFSAKEIRESGLVEDFGALLPSEASSFEVVSTEKGIIPAQDAQDAEIEVLSEDDRLAGITAEVVTPAISAKPARKQMKYGVRQGDNKAIYARPYTKKEIDDIKASGRSVRIKQGKAFKNKKEAESYAKQLNNNTSISEDVSGIKSAKERKSHLQGILTAKNINNDISSPEVGVIVEKFLGKKVDDFGKLSEGDLKFLSVKMKSLPQFIKPTQIPLFSTESMSAPVPQNRSLAIVPQAQAEPQPIEEVVTPEQFVNIEKLRRKLRAALDGFGLKDVGLSLDESLRIGSRNADGELVLGVRTIRRPDGSRVAAQNEEVDSRAEGLYVPDANAIFLSVDRIPDNLSPQEQENALASILDHEMIHAMRNMDLFTEAEWTRLTNVVMTKTKINNKGETVTYLEQAQRDYSDFTIEAQIEEAVAELTRDSRADPKIITGKPRTLLNRMITFLRKLKNSITGTGFDTFNSLIGRIESGEIGSRSRVDASGKPIVRTLRETDREVSRIFMEQQMRGGQSQADFLEPEAVVTDQPEPVISEAQAEDRADVLFSRKSSSPIESAIALAKKKFADVKIESEEEFFGTFWPNLMASVKGTVTTDKMGTAAKRSIRDINEFTTKNPKFADFYNEDMKATVLVLEDYFGKLSPDDIVTYQVYVGATSTGTGLKANVGDALKLFNLYKQEGNLDAIEVGPRTKLNKNGKEITSIVIQKSPFTISNASNATKARMVKGFERLSNELGGPQNAANFLREPVTVKELHQFNREMGYKGNAGDIGDIKGLVMQATGQDVLIPRMFIFGKKIGAFTQNLLGDYNYTTIDRWEARLVRSYFEGMFDKNYNLPQDLEESKIFQDFNVAFKDEYKKITGKTLPPATMQAMRWYYIINAAKQAGYTGATTDATVSEYTEEQINNFFRKGRNEGRRGRDEEATQEVRESGQAREEVGSVDALFSRRSVDDADVASTSVLQFNPLPAAQQAALSYMSRVGLPYSRPDKHVVANPERGREIANEYEIMAHDPSDPLVQRAYAALIDETLAQYENVLESGLQVELMGDADPYNGKPSNALADMRENNHLYVFPTKDGYGPASQKADLIALLNNPETVREYPMLAETRFRDINGEPLLANDVFRIVHDYFGHAKSGTTFRATGEENAWQNHASMYTPLARRAMTTETRGQNSWVNFGEFGDTNKTALVGDTVFALQKTGLMPIWTSEENRLSGDARRRRFEESIRDGSSGLSGAIDSRGRVALVHYSTTKLERGDPNKWGEGLSGRSKQELGRIRSGIGRTFFGVESGIPNGYRKETGLGNFRNTAEVDASLLYDYNLDPDGLYKGTELAESKDYNAYDLRIRDAGYAGFFSDTTRADGGLGVVVVMYDPIVMNSASPTGEAQAQDSLSKGSTPRNSIPEVSQEEIDKVVANNLLVAENAPPGQIPLYSVKAEPRAQYIAQNPDKGAKVQYRYGNAYDSKGRRLSQEETNSLFEGTLDNVKFSRSSEPRYSPQVQAEINRTVSPEPQKSPRQVYLEISQQTPIREFLTRQKQTFINKYARLENIYNEEPFRGVLADSSGFAAALFADRSRGVAVAVIKGGVPVYKNGITKVEKFVHNGKEYRGLIGVKAPLIQNEYNVNLENLAQSYAIARRSVRLLKEGKDTPSNAQSLSVLQVEINKYINKETGRPIVEEWYDAWQAYNEKTIEFLRATGVLDAETAETWRNQSDYVPFYRQAEDPDNNDLMPPVFSGMTGAAKFKELKGSESQVTVPLLEAITRNLSSAIDMGMKNVAQQRIVRDMISLGLASEVKGPNQGSNVVRFRVNGKIRAFSIEDPLIFESMSAMGAGEASGMLQTILSKPAGALRELITRDPAFMVVNMLRDTLSTFITSGASFTPLLSTLKNFNSGAEALEKYGVVGGYDFGNDPSDIYDDFNKEIKSRGSTFSNYLNLWKFLGNQTTKSDAATRKAVYDDVLARTGNEAEAAFQALEVINFSRRGSSSLVRLFTASIPFLNARFQGLDVLWRASRGRYNANKSLSRAAQTRNFIFRGAMLSGISFAYWMMVSDDEQYKERSEYEKDNYWIFPNLFSEKNPFMVPIPFEVGLIFKVIPERMAQAYTDEDSSRESFESAYRGLTSTLAINPLGIQLVAPVVEAVFNKNSYTGLPIESVFLNDTTLIDGLRSRVGTNAAATFIGEALNKSPLKVEHVMRGYGGTIGGYVLDVVDHVMRDPSITGDDSTQKASLPLDRLPMLKRFFASEFGRGTQEDYYELRAEVSQTLSTVKTLRDENRLPELQRFLEGREHLAGLGSRFKYMDKRMKVYREQIERIDKSSMSPEEKLEQREMVQKQRQQFLKIVPVLKKAVDMPALNPLYRGAG